VKKLVLLTLVVLSVTACRGGSAATSSTTATVPFQPAGIELAGVAFEVHQEPG
jgi:hypothetical protein